jgi:hypothetical protein
MFDVQISKALKFCTKLFEKLNSKSSTSSSTNDHQSFLLKLMTITQMTPKQNNVQKVMEASIDNTFNPK